jgi:enoyl-CoA hydratase
MILTGRGVSGEEAARMGLVNRLCETGEALDTALTLARALARLPQTCLRSDRMSVYEQWDTDLASALRRETERGMQVIGSGETMSGVGRWADGSWSFSEFSES